MKKIISLTLLFMMILSLFPTSVFAEWEIRNPSQAKGSNYTTSPALAKAFDAVFAGDIDVFLEIGCWNEQSMPLGYSMNTSKEYYSKSKATGVVYSGYQCYIYANAVYNKLFGEVPYHGTNLHHSRVAMIGSGGKNTLSYQEFVNAGIRSGAYIRTTPLSNNAYYGDDGHSMVLLYYDEGGVVYIEGNADNKGLVRIFNQTWEEFNNTELRGVKRYLCHIIQANDSYYEQYYPENKEVKDYLKKCTFTPSSYKIKAVKEANLRNMPCNSNTDDASKIIHTFPVGTTFTATGIYKNTEGNYWYRVLHNNNEYYLYAKNTTAVEMINDVNISGAKYPTTIIKGNSFTLEGVVSSKYITVNSLIGQLYNSSGKLVASKTVSVSNNSYSIKNSALDTAIKFGSLAAGTYRLVLIADVGTNFVTDSQKISATGLCKTILEKIFTVHEHKYISAGYETQHPHRAITKCSCGEEKYGSENFSTEIRFTAPTCQKEGMYETICKICAFVEHTQKIDKVPHTDLYERITEPTCATDGKKEVICRGCNSVIMTEGINAKGHGETYSQIIVEPTCGEEGKIQTVCKDCLQVIKTESIPSYKHEETVLITVDPTCSTEGYIREVCNACSVVIRTEILPKTEHTIQIINRSPAYSGDEYCTVCKKIISYGDEIEFEVLLGDVNGDGSVDAKDATQILRYANGKSSSLNQMSETEQLASADVNGDRTVDAKDATQILRYVNGKPSALS